MVCDMASHIASPRTAREGEHFYRAEKEVGRAVVNRASVTFHWLSPCQERRGIFLLSCWALLSLQDVRASPSGLPTLFEVSVYSFFTFSPFDEDLSLKASLIKSQVFYIVSAAFFPRCQGFLGLVSHVKGKVPR